MWRRYTARSVAAAVHLTHSCTTARCVCAWTAGAARRRGGLLAPSQLEPRRAAAAHAGHSSLDPGGGAHGWAGAQEFTIAPSIISDICFFVPTPFCLLLVTCVQMTHTSLPGGHSNAINLRIPPEPGALQFREF
jgi:hypothetical protein